jgi:hypothetical protein
VTPDRAGEAQIVGRGGGPRHVDDRRRLGEEPGAKSSVPSLRSQPRDWTATKQTEHLAARMCVLAAFCRSPFRSQSGLAFLGIREEFFAGASPAVGHELDTRARAEPLAR